MRLLDKPLSGQEIRVQLDMLNGNKSRILVSNDPVEIMSNLGFAIDRLSMIAYSRIKELNERYEDDL